MMTSSNCVCVCLCVLKISPILSSTSHLELTKQTDYIEYFLLLLCRWYDRTPEKVRVCVTRNQRLVFVT